MAGMIRERPAGLTEGDLAQDERGDQRHGIRLEEVCCHAGAVTHVVADVVRDRRGVAGVVLGDTGLDLADKVGADVSGLGEDTATNTHEHGQQSGTEAEALENLGRIALVDQHDRGRTQQAEAHGHHAHGATGAEGDPHAEVASGVIGGRGNAHVGLDRETHAEVPDCGGEGGSEQEEA